MLPSLVDSHCHLTNIALCGLNNNLAEVIHQARANGVEHMLSVCVELSDIPHLYDIASQYPEVSISVGLHPDNKVPCDLSSEQLVEFSRHSSCVAIGETGLDYYHAASEEARKLQQDHFRKHIRAAIAASKPLIIHTRQASEDTLRIMAEENAQSIGGVMHCFTEDWDVATRALDLNFYISISGIVTFKNAAIVQDVAKKVPIDRLLIETDAPYLAPVPFRGKQNHPALVKHVAESISTLRQIDFATLAHHTTENFYKCFNLSRRDTL